MENTISQSMESMVLILLKHPSLGAGVAGLNTAPEVPAMTMFRHIIFGAVIGILSKSTCEVRK